MPIDDDLRQILDLHRIAVVGASASHGKAAHNIPGFLQWVGYDVVPVNPNAEEVLGRHSYESLSDVEEDVDVVQIFRPSEEVSDIVDEALARDDVDAIWMQPGIHDEEAAERAERAGIETVTDRCMGVEYRRLMEPPGEA